MLERTMQANQAVIAGLKPEDMNRPTPCWGWSVRELINHMVGVNQHFAGAASGQAPAAGDQPTDLLGHDPAAAYANSTQAALTAWRAPGVLEQTLPFGPSTAPASLLVCFHQGDQLLHYWDLSKALGRPPQLDDDLVVYTEQNMRANLKPEFRGPGKAFGYAIACPDTASHIDRVAAFSGRQP